MTMWTGRGAALALAVVVGLAAAASAEEEATEGREKGLDTDNLFVFTTGTDVGEVGDREIEGETEGRLGKRSGSYAALSHSLGLQFVPLANLQVEIGATATGHAIRGLDDFDDRHRLAFDGLFVDLRYRLIERQRAGFGLAVAAEPHWGLVDETSGERADRLGVDFALLADTELVPDRVAAAFNLLYQPEASHSHVTGTWEREATLGLSAALMAQVAAGVFVGGEARYLRKYEGLGLDRLTGHALFVGPAISAKLNDKWWIGAAWAVQVAGRAVDEPGALDLTNFERHQVKLRIGVEF
jgi:hypothetical protein